MRVARRISAVLLGFVFFIAGILKLMDPVGAGLVVEAYLKFFHLTFLLPLSSLAGVADALLETIVGTALITGVWRKITGIVTGVLMAGFTVITLILYIANPNMDCGCFGEAVHLTHLQSLLKNIVLLALWALAFIPLSRQEPTRKIKYVSFTIASVSACIFFLYSALSIPLMDFTSFKPGEELMIPGEMDTPKETPMLSFTDTEGNYADSIALSGKIMVVSVYNTDKMSAHSWEKVATLVKNAGGLGFSPLILTASTPDEIVRTVHSPEILQYVYFADRRTLLTLNRSNGGATYISDGQIVTKWGINKFPDREKLAGLGKMSPTEALISENHGSRMKMQGFLLYIFAVMLLL